MSIDEAIEADAAVLSAVDRETQEIAEMVRNAFEEFNEVRDEWEPSGLDRDKLAVLADAILKRGKTTRS